MLQDLSTWEPNPMDYKEYEQAVARFYAAVGEPTGATKVYWNQRLSSQSGKPYQIDVLVEGSNGLQSVRTAIECKYLNKKVGRATVAAFATTIEDVGVEKGVIVTTVGFTGGAIMLAKDKNISLLEMRHPTEADWEGRIQVIRLTTNVSVPEFSDIEAIQDAPLADDSERIAFAGCGADFYITEPGREPVTIDRLLNQAINSEDNEIHGSTALSTREIRFPDGATLSVAGYNETTQIDGIRFKVRILRSQFETIVNGKQVVKYIAKELFLGKRFSVGTDGQVKETIC